MKTHAAVLWGRGEDWKIEEIDLDPPKSHEVLVKWAAAGLCHSDEHLQASDMGSAPPAEGAPPRPGLFPMVGGHEGGGVVLEVGPDVDSAPARGPCRRELLPDLRALQDVHHRALEPL